MNKVNQKKRTVSKLSRMRASFSEDVYSETGKAMPSEMSRRAYIPPIVSVPESLWRKAQSQSAVNLTEISLGQVPSEWSRFLGKLWV